MDTVSMQINLNVNLISYTIEKWNFPKLYPSSVKEDSL